MKLTLDYSVPLSVHVNTETGHVSGVWLGLDTALIDLPTGVFNRDYFENPEPGEYLPLEHPETVKALAVADRIRFPHREVERQVGFDLADPSCSCDGGGSAGCPVHDPLPQEVS